MLWEGYTSNCGFEGLPAYRRPPFASGLPRVVTAAGRISEQSHYVFRIKIMTRQRCDTGGVCGGAGHAGAGACPCRERLRGAKSGRQVGGFDTDAESPGPGGAGSSRRRNLVDHNGPGNEGTERGGSSRGNFRG